MSWIAMKMLMGDRAKFFGIVLGLTFASLLITQQGSIFCGLMCRTAGQIYDITGADLWVMDSNVRYIDDVKPMIENNLYRVRGVEGVEWAVPLYKGNARAKLNSASIDPATKRVVKHQIIEQVVMLGLDDSSLVGAPPPDRIIVGNLTDLRKPDAVLVDFMRLPKLYPGEPWYLLQEKKKDSFGTKVGKAARGLLAFAKEQAASLGGQPSSNHSKTSRPKPVDEESERKRAFYARFIGRELEMNDHRAIIIGVCEATPTFQSNAVMYTTYSRAKRFIPQERKLLSYVLAKAEKGLKPEVVAESIRRQTGLKARTSQEFIWDTIYYYAQYTGIPINFGITTLLGFLVGTAIAGQTFYNFTIENLKQFGALKAMGATNLKIVSMILLQAMVVGLLGYGMGVGLGALFGTTTKGGELAFYTPWQLLPVTAGAVVMICILSSVLSVRRVMVLEPAVVFRG
ncbi:ABC transporter permease [Singulisphaera sp. PoT]|uniref:ABC transporter permease n=1 Tax=Singulisphaera sp. PoT TaxID=3411797 RepID=UPI003BF57677